MGLDITAGSRIVFVEAYDDPMVFEDKYYSFKPGEVLPYVSLYPNEDFPGREAPLDFMGRKFACYRVNGETMGFRAGSYGGYNDWREQLCQLVNHVTPRQIWDNRDDPKVQAMPFYPLIDFSDCEGVIGSIAAARLASDFESYQARAERQDEYFVSKYREWRRACQLAADDGFIKFS
jgi:hypothetical protein